MKSNFNLPPGVTARDLDPKMVKCPNIHCIDGAVTEEDGERPCKICDGIGEVLASEIELSL